MEYKTTNLIVRIKGKLYALPCSLALTEDKTNLVILIKQGQIGHAGKLLKELVDEGKPTTKEKKWHLVCMHCQILLECDSLGVSLSEDDSCYKSGDELHHAEKQECICL